MKKKELEIKLQKLEPHPNPSPELEQYMTPGDIAASLLYLAHSHGSIKGKKIYDLGCGTGRLAIGAALLGGKKIIGVDIDGEALKIAKKNSAQADVENIEWIRADVSNLELPETDTVIQNPPFGVQKKGADMVFLNKALQFGKDVYSIHKGVPKNRDYISEQVKELGGRITNRIEKEFHIPSQFKYHTRKVYRFKVDLYRIIRR
ncbi:hypothetical protein AKJ37_01270 [candidate division MSBL1 archaeon SCGC-AAA259I09]|uniref:Methyltransferase domain-containing protein n=2 Tax=candidate division MSBL1 TaxID=215777 RepID=A0A133UVD2_9EURY|nr:hypothetical protein AKJ37_01270 [candidate division MSBL1 archaeon SCGC-AAA259I09]KXB00816.1 hypothetical protein AKJ40_00520 [candidate division MSBL1 archaeon SCGC-AAA259M10]